MSNSPLATCCLISPNRTTPRGCKIDAVTVFCYDYQATTREMLEGFHRRYKRASANYVIGYNGEIGLCVEESDGARATRRNDDRRTVTICVSPDTDPGCGTADAVYESLVRLLIDVCRRNRIPEFKWPETETAGYLCQHRSEIESSVNAALRPLDPDEVDRLEERYHVRQNWNDRDSQIGAYCNVTYAKRIADKNQGYKVYNCVGVCLYPPSETASKFPCRVQAAVEDLPIWKGPGTIYDRTENCTGSEAFTIVETVKGHGNNLGWGRLESGAGWVSLDYCKILE